MTSKERDLSYKLFEAYLHIKFLGVKLRNKQMLFGNMLDVVCTIRESITCEMYKKYKYTVNRNKINRTK